MSELYIWGQPITNQQVASNSPFFTKFSTDTRIQAVSSGQQNCMVLAEGELFGMGDNQEGQLGLGSLANTGLGLLRVELSMKEKIV